MRLTYFAAILVGTTSVVAVGCGGADDPLGGPYGGTANVVPPDNGNVENLSVDEDAGGADAGPSSSSGGGSSTGGSSGTGGSGSSSGGRTSSSSSSGATHDAGSAPSSGSSSGSKSGSGSSSGSTTSSSSSSGAASSSSGASSSGGTAAAPKWSQIFSKYLESGTAGNCTGCHRQMSSASASYSWLSGQGYIRGTSSILVASFGSCLSWYGGTMPPGGPRTDAQATSDMNAWAAAGAMNN